MLSKSWPSSLVPHMTEMERQKFAFHLESTLLELRLYPFEFESYHLTKEIGKAFSDNPLLPGVILTERGNFFGMISQRRFLEQMSRPYSLDLFANRPITALYRVAQTELLIVPGNTPIVAAAWQSLQRPVELLYEPLVVQIDANSYRLLDVHQLLVASAIIHELARRLLQTANDELNRLATLDSLTQVANRRRFDEYLEQEWRRLAREKAYLSLILCDIDYFKAYNDTYGHQAGDHCLREVAGAIRVSLKRPADLVARYGGEEFAVVLPNTDTTGALHIAEEIRARLKELQILHPHSTVSNYVTLSLGAASLIPNHQFCSAELIKAADDALYQAKSEGRDRCNLNSHFS